MRFPKNVSSFFWHPDSAFNLAFFRSFLFLIMLMSVNPPRVAALLSMSPDLRMIPPGMHWLSPMANISPDSGLLLGHTLRVFCAFAALGLFTSFTTAAAVILGLMYFCIEQFFGKVVHSTQAIMWFAMLLSASPCGDAFSLDALIRKWRSPSFHLEPRADSVSYGLPIRISWFLFGIIYFFPGIQKLLAEGGQWILSDNLANTIFHQWFWNGSVPRGAFRFDKIRYLTQIAAAFTVIFEIGFVFALFNSVYRWFFIAIGIFFHAANAHYLGFPFLTLRFSYLVFPNWSAILRRVGICKFSPGTARPSRSTFPVVVVGGFLILINSAFGAVEFYSWPFTSYPAFTGIYREHYQKSVAIELIDGKGKVLDSSAAFRKFVLRIRVVAWQARVKKVLIPGDQVAVKRELISIVTALKEIDPSLRCVAEVRGYLTQNSTLPEEWSRNPLTKKLTYVVPLRMEQDCPENKN